MYSKRSWRGLGGSSRKETTRDEVLAQAKAERAARTEARQRSKAATIIQSHWRSYAAKAASQQLLLQQWQEQYAAAAAQPNTLIPADELFNGAVRLLLMASLPLASSRCKQLLQSGGPLLLNTASNCSSACHSVSNSSSRVSSSPAAAAAKGSIALVLRGLSSGQPGLNYVCLGVAVGLQAWRVQAVGLCQLCCMVTAANPQQPDPVLDAAASRLLQLMTDTSRRLSSSSSSTGANNVDSGSSTSGILSNAAGAPGIQADAAAQQAAAVVTSSLCQQPMPLLQAVRRLALQRAQQQQQQHCSAPTSGGTALNAAAVTTAGLQRLMSLAVQLLEVCCSHDHDQQKQQQQTVLQQFVLVVLTTPGMAAVTPPAVKARLLQMHILHHQLLPTAEQLASSGQLCGLDALHCLANIAQLLTGCSPATAQLQQQPAQPGVGRSQHLEDATTAAVYCSTAVQLLTATNKGTSRDSSKQNGRILHLGTHAQGQCNAPQPGGLRGKDSSSDSNSCNTRPSAVDVLRDECWMLGTLAHLLQLRRVLTTSQPDGIVLWSAYCIHLMQDCSKVSEQPGTTVARTPSRSQADSNSESVDVSRAVLNVLSFSPDVLPAMWRWLAVTAGLPLEAPLQASRGLDIAAVAGGPEGLQPHVAMVMGLFCRCATQLLVVLDDGDLHQHQTPFSLGTSRAIASTLNSLVFHTAFPDNPQHRYQQQLPQQQQQAQQQEVKLLPATTAYGLALLREHAPVVLRGYYERDARQSFCQPNLWTEPYNNLMKGLGAQQQQQQQGGVGFTTAAVVQALLVSAGLNTDDDATNTVSMSVALPQRTAVPAAAAPAGPAVPGLRTNALLSLLRTAPQCVPFTVRLELFRQMLEQDKVRGCWHLSPAEGGPRPVKLRVRRDVLLEDAYRGLKGQLQALKGRLQVTFVNAQGVPEAGIDQGGLMKELLEQVVTTGTQPEYGLFTATEGTGLLYPNSAAEAIPGGLDLLGFLGVMVGKALYDGILLNLPFAPFFLRALQGGRAGFDDLAGLDSTLHANLLAVKACQPEQVEHLGLTFAAEQRLFGKTVQTELLPGGNSIPVTADNRLLYVYLLADYHLNTRLGRAAKAFAGGLAVILPPSWLRMFSPWELNQLISGGKDGGLDVNDMARYAHYSNGYTEASHTIRMFWRVVKDFTPQQRSALLRFITSTSRAPLGGFKHLQPPLTIHKVDCGGSPLAMIGVGKDVDRLPSASTCYNMLKLPNYKKHSTMKEKLLYAVQSNAGFELS